MKKHTFLPRTLNQIIILFVLLVSGCLNAQITDYPYAEDFESGFGSWYFGWNVASSWAIGTPSGFVINNAASGNSAMVTNLTGNYQNSEDGAVYSPSFNFSTLIAPKVQFNLWWNCEQRYDGVVFQSTTDNGLSWQNVGNQGSGINWYNRNDLVSLPGGSSEGWSGRNSTNDGSGGWMTVSHSTQNLAGELDVRFRLAFASDISVIDEGVGFDNFKINDQATTVISIPDPWFEQALLDEGIDSDNMLNGQILESDIYFVTDLTISRAIRSFEGLQYFSNLTNFIYSGYYNPTSNLPIDFSGNPNLKKVILNMSSSSLFDQINLSQNIALEELTVDVSTYYLQSLDLSQNINLKFLSLKDLKVLQNLDLSQNITLEELHIDDSGDLQSLDLLSNINLKVLDLSGFYDFLSLEIPQSLALEELYLSGFADLQSLDLSQNINLKVVNLRLLEDLQNLDITNLSKLEELRLESLYTLNNLDLSNQILLNEIYIDNLSNILTLDLSNSIELNTITILADYDDLRAINLKNGFNNLITSLDIFTTGACILVDDVEYAENNSSWQITNSLYTDVLCITTPQDAGVTLSGNDESYINSELESWLDNGGNSQIYFYSGSVTWDYSLNIFENEYNNIIYETSFIASSALGEQVTLGKFTLYSDFYLAAGEDFVPIDGDVAGGIEEEGSLCDQESGIFDLNAFNRNDFGDPIDFNSATYENAVINYVQVLGVGTGPPGATFEGTKVDFPDTGAGQFSYYYMLNVSIDVQFFGMSQPMTLSDEASVWHWLTIPFDPGPDKEITVCEGQSLTLTDLYNALDIEDGTDAPEFNPDNYWTPSTYQGPGVYTFDAGNFLPQCGGVPTVVTVTETAICDNALAFKVFLQGSYDVNTGLMKDDMRSSGLLSTTSPYVDGLTCDSSVFNLTGVDAIIDWVWLEIRDSGDLITVISSRSALLQADGDIVDIDGVSPLNINIANDDYYLMLSHRNHLGVLTLSTVTFDGNGINLDLTISSSVVEGGSNAIASFSDGKFGLFAGDFNGDGQIQNTDTNAVNPLIGLSGYSNADINMDGQVQNTDVNLFLNPNIGKGEQFLSRLLFAKMR